MHVRPFAQLDVVVQARPAACVPAPTQSTLPLVLTTSHVCAELQPHCGTRPQRLLGGVFTQVVPESGGVPESGCGVVPPSLGGGFVPESGCGVVPESSMGSVPPSSCGVVPPSTS